MRRTVYALDRVRPTEITKSRAMVYLGSARGALPREMRRAAALVFPQTLATRT